MKNVILFTTSTWPHCKTAKEFLSQNRIHYIEKDINVDREARGEMIKRKISGVPTFLIGEDIVIGLDREKVLNLVDHRVVECTTCHKKVRVPTNEPNKTAKCPNCKSILISTL